VAGSSTSGVDALAEALTVADDRTDQRDRRVRLSQGLQIAVGRRSDCQDTRAENDQGRQANG
jgi:hypothetical protein